MNNDYLKGYIAALNNIIQFLDSKIASTDDYVGDENSGYFSTKLFVKEVKSNYKKLVKELNETQSKKDPS